MDTRFFEHLADGVCLTDEQGRLTYANPAAAKLLGPQAVERSSLCKLLCEPLGHVRCGLLEPDGPEAVTVRGRQGPIVSFDWRGDGVTRRERYRDLCVRCLRQPGMHLVLIQDDTPRMELERHKEDWRHMIAHDLRAPMAAVMGTLRLLQEEQINPELRPLIRASIRAGERMMELLTLYLDVAKLDAGLMPCSPEKVALRQAVTDVGLELRIAALDNQAPDGAEAWADRTLLHRILQNLLDNAVKYSPAGSKVTVTAKREGPWQLLSVADQGPGIPHGDLGKVFDRFYQAGLRRAGKLQGVGLGLTFCQEAARAMGGELAVASRPGSGSVFTIALPAEEIK